MGRPGGVTVIAVLDFIGAVFCVLGGIALLVGASFLGAALSQGQGGNAAAGGIMAMLGGAVSIVLIIIGGVSALVGWGMWTLKSWARIVQMIFAGLGLLLALSVLLHFSGAILVGFVIRVAINGLILWYLMKPEVAAAFNGNQTKAAGA
jgi:hypothetical protein